MRTVRALWRLMRVLLHVLHGFAVAWTPGGSDRDVRLRRVQWWSSKLLRVLGIGLVARGQPRPGGSLLVANHISWLDIAALHSMCPHARFVSKAEVRRWPLINSLVAAGGTLYIERRRRHDALRVVHDMAEALKAGDTVAVFPEGTTSDGHSLLPFHANLLQAAISGDKPVQPVALRFGDAAHPYFSPAVSYVGDTSLVSSLWKVARAEGLTVYLDWLPPHAPPHAERRELAEQVRHSIAQALRTRGSGYPVRS